MRNRKILATLAVILVIAASYLGVLFGLVYTAVKVVKYAWQ
jgi:hypothetical protein